MDHRHLNVKAKMLEEDSEENRDFGLGSVICDIKCTIHKRVKTGKWISTKLKTCASRYH